MSPTARLLILRRTQLLLLTKSQHLMKIPHQTRMSKHQMKMRILHLTMSPRRTRMSKHQTRMLKMTKMSLHRMRIRSRMMSQHLSLVATRFKILST